MVQGEYEDIGEISLHECTGGMIPVNGRINPIEEKASKFNEIYSGGVMYVADCLGPKRNTLSRGTFKIIAKKRETLIELVNEHIVPLYESALLNLKEKGEDRF